MKTFWASLLALGFSQLVGASCPHKPEQGFQYQWPVHYFSFPSQRQNVSMAYMDVAPSATPNGQTFVLLHGKNFCAQTWNQTAIELSNAGYRVIIPDQIGFCKSFKPERYQYSLQQLAFNTHGLLSSLGFDNKTINVLGHSMGGMLATRYSLMYPAQVQKLILTNPIGLEDWKALGVPYRPIDTLWEGPGGELSQNYTTIRAYQQATYYVNTWDPSYDVWVNMLDGIYHGPERLRFTYTQALVTEAILNQPIVYEFKLLKPKTLLIIGDKDNTALGKAWAPDSVKPLLGHYDVLGKQIAAQIPDASLIEFADLGHAPQIQAPVRYHEALLGWLEEN